MTPLAMAFLAFISTLLVTVFTALLAMGVRLYGRMAAMENSVATLTTQVSPLWKRVQTVIAEDLHHPKAQYAEMDKLLEQLEALSITAEGRVRLKVLLQARSVDMAPDITADQRASANLMLHVMDKVIEESEHPEKGTTVESVSIPAPEVKP